MSSKRTTYVSLRIPRSYARKLLKLVPKNLRGPRLLAARVKWMIDYWPVSGATGTSNDTPGFSWTVRSKRPKRKRKT